MLSDKIHIKCLRKTSDKCVHGILHLICIYIFSNCVNGNTRQTHNKLEKNRWELSVLHVH